MNIELLDELDQLRAAATPGPWEQDAEFPDVVAAGPSGVLIAELESSVADAALIVAAVNAVPQLTAALRAVLALADELDDKAPRVFATSAHASAAYVNAANRIRAALGGGQ